MLTLDPLDAASMDALVEALVPGMRGPARAKITAQAQASRCSRRPSELLDRAETIRPARLRTAAS